jgi:3-hydroxyacyl-[acyl-carrier-protein] dehydratase
MLGQLLFDIAAIDLNHLLFDQEGVRQVNPQRGAMEMLNGIIHADAENHRILGFKDIRSDEFWVAGHIPGRPLFPGVLMIECAAQLASFYAKKYVGWTGFMGFGGVEQCRFRMQVTPPCRMYILGERLWQRKNVICCKHQGVVDGNLAFEATIIGARM